LAAIVISVEMLNQLRRDGRSGKSVKLILSFSFFTIQAKKRLSFQGRKMNCNFQLPFHSIFAQFPMIFGKNAIKGSKL